MDPELKQILGIIPPEMLLILALVALAVALYPVAVLLLVQVDCQKLGWVALAAMDWKVEGWKAERRKHWLREFECYARSMQLEPLNPHARARLEYLMTADPDIQFRWPEPSRQG